MISTLTRILDPVYRWRLVRQLRDLPRPRHIALVMDGNRRWARAAGHQDPSVGHRAGAAHLTDVLGWCERRGIDHVTVFVASTENLIRRPGSEIAAILSTMDRLLSDRAARTDNRWQLHLSGRIDLLPDNTRNALKSAAEKTAGRGLPCHLSIAIGYGGRQEIIDALRDYLDDHRDQPLERLAATFEPDEISRRLYQPDQPDPDLIIRTSGEIRLSNFLLWQGVRAEYYFCDSYWPGFSERDFLRALRTFGRRRSRAG
ncbi:polyprenyl diphosphate synthase [Microlunatus soli]|uniref:Isoprenyl transferase n=1 Tax=Microlunatus soli TaxID=630515 RepID=A0A1H1TAW2_9ACTN|nr:polyprenyl diphosphate synthase [Microlunatus soli]SDS57231.1 Undecaprenyl pyrophosphate synthetase [Microlunatus soli]